MAARARLGGAFAEVAQLQQESGLSARTLQALAVIGDAADHESLRVLLSDVESFEELLTTLAVAGLVEELSRHSPLALAMAKRVLNTAYDGPLHLGLELEGLAYGLLRQTHDFREGVEAFGEKRPPEFTGE